MHACCCCQGVGDTLVACMLLAAAALLLLPAHVSVLLSSTAQNTKYLLLTSGYDTWLFCMKRTAPDGHDHWLC
jgi:hypothetical protein